MGLKKLCCFFMQMKEKKSILPQKDKQTFSIFVRCLLSKLKARFLSDARQAWGLLPSDKPWRSQICIAKCLNSYREDFL